VKQFPPKTTFDSSRSPERGEKKNRPDVALAALDIDALKKRLAKVEAEAKANDPQALKSEIAQLKAERLRLERDIGAKAKTAAPDPQAIEKAEQRGFEVAKKALAVAADAELKGAVTGVLEELRALLSPAIATIDERLKVARHFKPRLASNIVRPVSTVAAVVAPPAAAASRAENVSRIPQPPSRVKSAPDGRYASLTKPQRELLRALAWWLAMGHDAPTRTQVAAIAGWKPRGSNLRNRLTELSAAGLVEYPTSGLVRLTPAGVAAAPAPDTSRTLIDSIRSVLTKPQAQLSEALIDAQQQISRADLAAMIGWEPGGSNLRNRLTELSQIEVVSYPSTGMVTLQDWVTG
jgi:hypothetical protein